MLLQIWMFCLLCCVKMPLDSQTLKALSHGTQKAVEIAAWLSLSLVVEAFCAVETVLASQFRGRHYHSYKQQITFVFPKLKK